MTQDNRQARPIILDCDPGHDDAVAIILALGSPAVELLAVTTVGGNQTLEKVTRNARAVLTVCGREDVPVYAGSPRPLVCQVSTAGSIHGETGLDGVDLPAAGAPLGRRRAAQFIADAVMSAPAGTITLVATGPLTNIALAARLEPGIVERVREVVIMGGGFHEANWTAAAEFNIWVDPEAARIVFEEDWDVTMVGLDLTHQALATEDVEARIGALGTELSRFFVGLMGFFRASHGRTLNLAAPPLHDPCAVAYVVDPSIVATKKAPVAIETRGQFTTGMTVVDLRANAATDCRTKVAYELDRERFWDLVEQAFRRLGDGADTGLRAEP
ncbi:MAG: nucleoside hydrolase [Actinomycetaceae bacterium]|nr:nucleoside hydrolase [Actinomycetaceae bacterium]